MELPSELAPGVIMMLVQASVRTDMKRAAVATAKRRNLDFIRRQLVIYKYRKKSNFANYGSLPGADIVGSALGADIGFALMMVLDVVLG